MKRRSTKHKQAILKSFEKHHLLSAGELEKETSADPSTIYRNLKRLEDDGVLRSVQIDAITKYELADKHGAHDHFICNSCQAVKTIFVDESSIKGELPTTGDLSVTVRGVCDQCR